VPDLAGFMSGWWGFTACFKYSLQPGASCGYKAANFGRSKLRVGWCQDLIVLYM